MRGLCACVLLLCGCDSVWSPFDRDNPGNCVADPTICAAGQVCNQQTEVCEPAPVWHQEAKLVRDGTSELGLAVALSGDSVLVGGTTGASLFVRTGTSWALQHDFVGTDSKFGAAVALDRDTALIGAYEAALPEMLYAGAAYLYTRAGSTWGGPVKLTASDAATNAQFGSGTAVSGTTAIVGAYDGNDAYVEAFADGQWTEQGRLTAAGSNSLGISAAMDGDTALVGADGRGNLSQGKVYVFVRSGAAFTLQGTLTGSDGGPQDYFGQAVALSGDTALVGAYRENGIGAAYVFVRSGATWTQQARLSAPDGSAGDSFGVSVAVVGDQALVGASGATVTGKGSTGASYLFARSAGAWSLKTKLFAADGKAGDGFGRSVALSSDTAVVGAFTASPNAVYVFRYSSVGGS